MFNELRNFIVIDKVTIVDNLLFAPYLFEAEYEKLVEHNDKWAWFGHFEFKGFVLTGHSHVLEHGPDARLFSGPKKIFSGHFHKRQQGGNVVYIGNAMPCDFGDAGDYARGMATYDVLGDVITYTDWPDAPSYYKTTLSAVIADQWLPKPKMKVKCVVDVPDFGYQDAQELREMMVQQHGLRDFILEEDRAEKQGLLEGENVKVTESMLDFTSIDEMVIKQLEESRDEKSKIKVDKLVEIYKSIVVEAAEVGEE
jgi:hypothetical protein